MAQIGKLAHEEILGKNTIWSNASLRLVEKSTPKKDDSNKLNEIIMDLKDMDNKIEEDYALVLLFSIPSYENFANSILYANI